MDSIQINKGTDSFIRVEKTGNGGMTVEVVDISERENTSCAITLSEAQAKQLTDWLSTHVQP